VDGEGARGFVGGDDPVFDGAREKEGEEIVGAEFAVGPLGLLEGVGGVVGLTAGDAVGALNEEGGSVTGLEFDGDEIAFVITWVGLGRMAGGAAIPNCFEEIVAGESSGEGELDGVHEVALVFGDGGEIGRDCFDGGFFGPIFFAEGGGD